MSTWKELYDDMQQELALYQEEIKMNPVQGMRMLSKGLSEFQRLTGIAEAVKTITPTVGQDVTLHTTTYPMGSDVMEIIEILDVDGYSLMSTSQQQFNEILERVNSGYNGLNETPAHMSHFRERPGGDLLQWETVSGIGMVRIYTVFAQAMRRYPAQAADTTFTVRYKPHYDQYSTASTQWAAWSANEGAFETNFAGTTPPIQLLQWFPAFVSFAVGQYLRSQNVLSGKQPMYLQYDQEFRRYVDEANTLKPVQTRNLVAPYNVSPFS